MVLSICRVVLSYFMTGYKLVLAGQNLQLKIMWTSQSLPLVIPLPQSSDHAKWYWQEDLCPTRSPFQNLKLSWEWLSAKQMHQNRESGAGIILLPECFTLIPSSTQVPRTNYSL